VDDLRESPSLKLMELLEARGATVDYFDPWIVEVPRTREHPEFAGRRSIGSDFAGLDRYHAVLIATDHDDVDYRRIVDGARLVIHTRNVGARLRIAGANIVKA